MCKIKKAAFFAAFLIAGSNCFAESLNEYDYENVKDITDLIPIVTLDADRSDSTWKFIPDVAQYKSADWSTCVGLAHGATRESAKMYAESNPNITFFFYVKGPLMILENMKVSPPEVRCFYQGDAVFFTGEPEKTICWGTATEYSDGYVKR